MDWTQANAALIGMLIGAALGGILWVGVLSWLMGKIVDSDIVKELAGAALSFGIGVWDTAPQPPSLGTYMVPLLGVAFWLPMRRYKAIKAGRPWPVVIPANAPKTIGYRLCFSGFVLFVVVGCIVSPTLVGTGQDYTPLLAFLFFLACGLSLFLFRRWTAWLFEQPRNSSNRDVQ